ncbi:MAG TPA: amidohydrolase family protein [Solirubrobacterales bacterium]|nr:amidohydrolase family protein [Solirubrobacterales bacterium]
MPAATATTEIRRVDCDIHPILRSGLRDLAPHLTDDWRARFGMAKPLATDQFGAAREATVEMPRSPFYFPTPGAFRKDAVPPDGGPPASDPAHVVAHHLEPNEIDRGLLLGQNMFGLGAFVQPGYATALASAFNDWLEATWLEADQRFRGTIVVAPQEPERAAAEVRRCAERSQAWVAVMLPLRNALMGEAAYHPIYAEAERQGIPIGVHISGIEGVFPSAPPMPGGIPATYFEVKSTYTTVYQANLASMVIRGVFEQFPNLKLVMTECGIGWLPELLWRMDTNWKALRDEAPWVKRPPSEYVFDHVRFTSQPFVEPPTAKQVRDFCEMIQVERTLMFASDYPHYDFDDPTRTLAQIPKPARRAVEAETALDFFGERLRRPGPVAAGAEA